MLIKNSLAIFIVKIAKQNVTYEAYFDSISIGNPPTMRAGVNPLETVQKILSLLAYTKLNFTGNVYVGEFF